MGFFEDAKIRRMHISIINEIISSNLITSLIEKINLI